jgi:hypothetical protein
MYLSAKMAFDKNNKMKQKIFTLLLLTVIYFTSCQKNTVTPATTQDTTTKKTVTTVPASTQDTVSYNVKGYLRVQLANYGNSSDAILIAFNPTAKSIFVKSEDAPTFQGFGAVSLSSLSSDNVALAINTLPLTNTGQTVALVVNAKTTGVYKLNLTAINSIPTAFDIWLKDKFKKDSLDFRNNPSYAFNLNTADTNSFGAHRFSLVIREK